LYAALNRREPEQVRRQASARAIKGD